MDWIKLLKDEFLVCRRFVWAFCPFLRILFGSTSNVLVLFEEDSIIL